MTLGDPPGAHRRAADGHNALSGHGADTLGENILAINRGPLSLRFAAFHAELIEQLNDLMHLAPPAYHPHATDAEGSLELFTADKPVVFAFHGYIRMIHDLDHARPEPECLHVRGYMEEGTTATPFDMVVANSICCSRLAMTALRSVPRLRSQSARLIERFEKKQIEHDLYIREQLADLPEIRDKTWNEV